jgi:hypothetical protein
MKHPALALALLVLAVPARASNDERRTISESFDLAAGQEVRVDFPVGELRLEGTDGTKVSAQIELTCKHESRRCAEAMERVELDSDVTAGRLRLEIDKEPGWFWDNLEIDAEIRLPADRHLRVEMGVGTLEVEGMRAELDLDLGVGEVDVTMPAERVHAVRLDAGVGETSLRLPGHWVDERRSLLVGSELQWDEGRGDADVWVDVGVGEATVRLIE